MESESVPKLIKGPGDMPELAALKYVVEHTSIPVPRSSKPTSTMIIYLYIEMEYVAGKDLGGAWRHLSEGQKKHIIAETASYVSQLRSLEPPHQGIVASAILDGVLDHRIGTSPFGPFTTHKGFHSYIRGNLPIEDCTKGFGAEVTECHTTLRLIPQSGSVDWKMLWTDMTTS